MEFLIVPLYVIAGMLGIFTLISIIITAIQRSDTNMQSIEYAMLCNRTKYLVSCIVASALMFTSASYIDHKVTPSFRTLYSDCINAAGGDGNAAFRGTIQRQSSCVVIAREIQKSQQ